MTLRIFFFSLFSFLLVLPLEAGMVRVVGVADGQTLIVERGGVATNVKLAGIETTDDAGARALLQWTLVGSWVLLEEQQGGGALVYKSPDALFVNRELVLRGLARATLPSIEPARHVVVTFLGVIKSPAAAGKGSGTTASAPVRPSRRRRPPKP
jgi:hypothetical protein